MTTDLILQSLRQAYWLRKRPKGVIFHSDRGSQYTSKTLRKELVKMNIKPSMGDVGACWDNAVVERFFGSLKHDWILKVHHKTREEMANDVAASMRNYNLERLHTANGDMSPVEYEKCKNKVSTFAWPNRAKSGQSSMWGAKTSFTVCGVTVSVTSMP
ncbi:MAG: DDE-type integrase/transposase/recombinase [Gammaproteobacteria bacterium]|jgi:putative transposase|nr:integrase core domain-containing protein [Pseudomonas sp.]NLO54902.1 DDE-type integrase/transposase/recombinase [Gammaproteobacteria bacterium]